MKPLFPVALGLALATYGLFGQAPTKNGPTKQEIIDAYQSKSGGTFGVGGRWERWRVREVRGWAIKFKKLSEDSGGYGTILLGPVPVTKKYRVRATKNNWCSEYRLSERIPAPPFDQNVKASIEVESATSKACN